MTNKSKSLTMIRDAARRMRARDCSVASMFDAFNVDDVQRVARDARDATSDDYDVSDSLARWRDRTFARIA